MSEIRFGCQFYTWQMSGKKYVGKLPHISKIVKEAGFSGIEPETCMLGSYYDDPLKLKYTLEQNNLKLGAIAGVFDWTGSKESEIERDEINRIFKYLKYFPGTHFVLGQMPGKDRSDLYQRQKNAIKCINSAAIRAEDRGISCSFHPNSPSGSVFRTHDDYRLLVEGIDTDFIGLAPDTGHIARGGMDVVETFKMYESIIKHVHFKDMASSGEWTAMGDGIIDFPGIVKILKSIGFNGWIMVEEESPEASKDPDTVMFENGKYLKKELFPLV